jgi:hypothetical protein
MGTYPVSVFEPDKMDRLPPGWKQALKRVEPVIVENVVNPM